MKERTETKGALKKRLLVVIALLGLVSIPLSNLAIAGKPEKKQHGKVKICHLEGIGEVPWNPEPVCRGHVIITYENGHEYEETPAYHEAHGDHRAIRKRKEGDLCSRSLESENLPSFCQL